MSEQNDCETKNAKVEKNALLIKSKSKLPSPIKSKLKRLGAIWDEAYQGYVVLLEKKNDAETLLVSYHGTIDFSTLFIDPVRFTTEGKAKNNRELRISILQEQMYEESMQLMVDIHSYNPSISEFDFDTKPEPEGKTPQQMQKEAEFYERRQAILNMDIELKSLQSNSIETRQGTNSFLLDENGLWLIESEKNNTWLSSPLMVTARTRDENGLNHGKLLEFDDADGVHHIWAMPMEMLAGDCMEFRSTLMNAGLEISTASKARQHLADYVQRANPAHTVRCVAKTGWHSGGFVLPDGKIGRTGHEKVIIQGKTFNFRSYRTAGTMKEWQQFIANPAIGNSRLIFAISIGFGGPCLDLMEMEGGGFHFRSQSSSGKTTALRAAASVYGDKNFMRKWKATINGLETIAFQHNDTLLCLDEIGEMNGFALGEAAYMLSNGSGKERSKADGGLRETLTWRLLFLSSGETSLSAHMEQAGKKSKAGQEIRIADVPADTGKFGLFEELHGLPNGSIFAEELTKNTQKYYGTAIREFLKKITDNISAAKEFIKSEIDSFLAEAVPKDASGQIHRVATRFALVAAAGELATQYNITTTIDTDPLSRGWAKGMAKKAALKCFYDWLHAFGGMKPQEETQLVADLYYFIEQHGESRFTDWHANSSESLPPTQRTHNRAGFRKTASDGVEFYIFPETFKRDICKGLDEKFVKEVLYKNGLLKKDSEGKYTRSAKPASESKSQRFYLIVLANSEE